MSLRDDVGQLFTIGFEGTVLPPEAERLLTEGRVGGAILFVRNIEGIDQVCALNASIARAARDDEEHAPPLLSVDQEGGRVQRLRAFATDVPSMREVGNACSAQGGEPDLAYRVGALLAREVSCLGFGMDFTPVVDVDTNPANPIIGARSFARDPAVVSRLASAFVRGMQEAGVAACAKHFPGHGDTDMDSHLALPRLPHGMERLNRVELPPFEAAVRAGVSAIMTAHVVFDALDPTRPATLSTAVLGPLLRTRMGFTGVIISDDLDMKAVADNFPTETMVQLGLEAGVDHFLCCRDLGRAEAAIATANRLAERDTAVAARVRESAARMRALKKRFLGAYAPPDPREARQVLRAPAHLKLVDRVRALQGTA
ncbi:MAG: beta-N-acetylhexosaminidase [Deltaproteobacteria bacterium]|nr:beta-N-acetylhexosaminidase [Deltaproteobacteria bacterium]